MGHSKRDQVIKRLESKGVIEFNCEISERRLKSVVQIYILEVVVQDNKSFLARSRNPMQPCVDSYRLGYVVVLN